MTVALIEIHAFDSRTLVPDPVISLSYDLDYKFRVLGNL